ncbi:MAG: transporter permease [Caulobacteraceae bacterium]|nr:transporter permease [Caulobacteraceae bacterium]
MWTSYLTAALRNLWRNRLHTAITTLSLTLGFAAVLIAALIWRYETTNDRFWPNAERIFLITQWDWQGARPEGLPVTSDAAQAQVGPLAQQAMGEVEKMTRLSDETLSLSRGQASTKEQVRWADPDFFQFFPVKTLAGDLSTALAEANSIVLTKTLAEKYFGDQPALGQTLTATQGLTGLPLRVSAVIADLPRNTHILATGFVSGVTAQSALNKPLEPAYTYILARPRISLAVLQRGLAAIPPPPLASDAQPHLVEYRPLALSQVYLKPKGYGGFEGSRTSRYGMRTGQRAVLPYSAALAGVILAVAAINFIALMTARGAGRAVEVGVRKACGARRRDLVAQFLGEALLLAVLALVFALALVEMVLPLIGAISLRPVSIDYVRDAPLLALALVSALLIGALAGLYPALALASYRPAAVLKGGLARTPGSARLRQIMVAAQFFPLVCLAIFALAEGHADAERGRSAYAMVKGDPLLINETCTPGLKAALLETPGVEAVACPRSWSVRSGNTAMGMTMTQESPGQAMNRKNEPVRMDNGEVSAETLRFFQVRMLAGRSFADADEDPNHVLINETTLGRLGYARPQDAIGQTVSWRPGLTSNAGGPQIGEALRSAVIIGVMADRWKPDFESLFYRPAPPADPAAASSGMGAGGIVVRIAAGHRDAALAAIDRAWALTGAVRPMERSFYSEKVEAVMTRLNRATYVIAASIGIGLVVASLGLFGVAAFLADQRTKEIGVRKALGASRAAVLLMLSFQFVRPVLIANLIACPLVLGAFGVLQTGVYPSNRVPLGPDIFASVLAVSLALALAATFTHAWRATGARPVVSLRSE